jgi:iron(III) transport system substrate-binding protein
MKTQRRDFMKMVAVGLAAAGPAHRARAQNTPEWNQLVEAAKKEGNLVVYTAAVGQPAHIVVGRAFEKKYGIQVSYLEARASEIRERIRTEQAAGRFIGDLSHNGATTTALQMAEGTFQPHGGIPNAKNLRPPFKSDDTRVPVFASAYAILVNTNLVKPADEPKSWKDLLNPKWKGKILADDMRALGGGSVTFFVLHDQFGREYHDKLALNQPVWSRDLRASERRVARGDFPIWIPMSTNSYSALKGLPVKLITPVEGYPYITYEMAVLKNAPHAARLFIDFFVSDEAQLIQDQLGLSMVTKTKAPPGTAEENAIRNARLMGTTDASRQDEMLRLSKEIYK